MTAQPSQPAPGAQPFSAEAAALLAAFQPPVVSFHFGLPEPALVARAKAESQGLGDFSPLWARQNVRGCKGIPAAQLTRELAAGALRS